MLIGYRYALKQIAEMERKGSISFSEISGNSKMSTQQLKGLLEIMERVGHVEKVTAENIGTSSSCSGSCKSCGVGGCCGRSIVSFGTIYRLTEKERKVCQNQTG